jgi:RNA polymerase sigma-70 factor (ECF subfamily)
MEMPPQPYWFAGRDRIAQFLRSRVLTRPGKFILVPTSANGQPAYASYLRAGDGPFRAYSIQVLTARGGRVTRIVSFNDGSLAARFGLPGEITASSTSIRRTI